MARVRLELAKTLNKRQQQAAEMTANGVSHPKICEVLNISKSTLTSWRTRSPAFRQQVMALQKGTYEDTASRTFALANASVGCLARMIADPETPASVKAQCCGIALGHQMRLLDYGLKVTQHESLLARLERIEQRQGQQVMEAEYVETHQLSPAP